MQRMSNLDRIKNFVLDEDVKAALRLILENQPKDTDLKAWYQGIHFCVRLFLGSDLNTSVDVSYLSGAVLLALEDLQEEDETDANCK
jgi:hypothetical protein